MLLNKLYVTVPFSHFPRVSHHEDYIEEYSKIKLSIFSTLELKCQISHIDRIIPGRGIRRVKHKTRLY